MEPLLICNLHFDCFIGEHAPICSWFIVGIVGPLTPLPVSLSVRSIGRGRSVVVAVNPCSRLDCLRLSLPYPSAALSLSLSSFPPSLLPSFHPRSNRAPIEQLVPSLAVAVVFNLAEGREGRGSCNIVVAARGYCTASERASESGVYLFCR